ncbi:phosphate signaling complex protein PhoU [Demequina pelophila]|uniref:phosphate signaling complex protein PhoU n=1 Tax=Demequina pelophila TaxID=1638984 RepID=UPI000780B573|nr:phosphate signaling complex protein PhoU [Demequina pelophila]
MRTLFTAEMSDLADDLIAMSRLVETAIDQASDAVLNGDLDLAQSVIASDEKLDELTASVDERCVLLIAQQQPVGLDLRSIIASLRISASLERMGDLAEHIAKDARRSFPGSAIPESHRDMVHRMAELSKQTAKEVTQLLETRDLNVAAAIVEEDDEIDALHEAAYKGLVDESYTGNAQETLDVALLARYYERFGDHAVGISRRIVYLVTGDHSGGDAQI